MYFDPYVLGFFSGMLATLAALFLILLITLLIEHLKSVYILFSDEKITMMI